MLKGKNAIVTGATRGIGREIAKKLAALGVNILINYRSNDKEAEELKIELENMGVTALVYKCDISDFDGVQDMINFAKEYFNKIDIMINNAGITKDTLVLRMKKEDFNSVIDVNLKGVFNCIKGITPIMVRQREGNIINLSSVVGIVGNAGQVNYSASKAGVIGMTKSLAKELGGRGIRVNAVAPGFIETDMTYALGDKFKDEAKKSIPLKRLGEAKDVANLVAFLASEESSYITGQVINVDGGMVM
ncbi:3-oxoacyl-[acyl-carrier-protein] reductase [Clostridium thermobutyricum]|uniref:3-oxoacyl-[acyl-carrier-protein] reductase n=1 Tax=Clostridium thermobutyricum TaxID=29372 RepID=UPI0018A8860C|nr:3-oxoacyl-[acyl-carrier-protein] reductase [Clostridium thermobutyricum]